AALGSGSEVLRPAHPGWLRKSSPSDGSLGLGSCPRPRIPPCSGTSDRFRRCSAPRSCGGRRSDGHCPAPSFRIVESAFRKLFHRSTEKSPEPDLPARGFASACSRVAIMLPKRIVVFSVIVGTIPHHPRAVYC